MKWYAVHSLLGFYYKDGNQGPIPVYENIFLILASSHEEARTKAELISRNQEGDSKGTLTWENRPAFCRFVGIRKTVVCEDADKVPHDGTEVTYTELQFASQEDLNQYIKGEDVTIRCVDYFPESPQET